MSTKIADHEFEIEPPDTVVMRYRGRLTVPDFTRTITFLYEHCSTWPHMLLLVDLSRLEAIPADVRKIVPDVTGWMPMRGTVICGASFTIRTIAVMLLKMINLVRGTDNPSSYTNTEAEAREWIERRRIALREGGQG